MATADNNVVMSSEAVGLIDCFSAGLDDLIIEIAERMAKDRLGDHEESSITVDVQDVKRAADLVFNSIRKGIEESKLPKELGPEIDRMHDCLLKRCEEEMSHGEKD